MYNFQVNGNVVLKSVGPVHERLVHFVAFLPNEIRVYSVLNALVS